MRGVFAAALLAATTAAAAQAPLSDAVIDGAAAVRDRALEENRAHATLSALLTEVGPRFAGTHGDQAAIGWALRALRDAGLDNVRAEPVEVPRWVRGHIAVEITAPFPQSLVAVALGGSVGTPDGGIEAPVLMVADLDELRSLSENAVAGKIVFFNKRMERREDGAGYGQTVPARTQGPSEAAARGAVGVVIRSVGTSDERVAHTGATRYKEGVAKIPAASLSNPDADTLERQLATGRQVTLTIDIGARELSPGRSANVIGELRGRGPRADEIVLLGAHLDSWDITPGAHDDAAGVAIVTEVARLLAAERRRPAGRTIRVVLFANEEFGLSGARAYADAREDEIARHAIAIEADAGGGRVWGMRSGVAETALPATEQIHALLAPLGIERLGNDGTGGADLTLVRKAGVPTMDLRHDMSVYFDVHHTMNDTLSKIDPDELTQSVAAYAAFTYAATYGDVDFGRHPGVADEAE